MDTKSTVNVGKELFEPLEIKCGLMKFESLNLNPDLYSLQLNSKFWSIENFVQHLRKTFIENHIIYLF